MRASVLSIGDELVLGEGLDTNSRWISTTLRDLGIEVYQHRTVGDDRAVIARAMRDLAGEVDLLICSGGLGPTKDDLTREAFGDVASLGYALVSAATIIPNLNGTAPGLRAMVGKCLLLCLPGPPNEMQPMLTAVIARGEVKPGSRSIATASVNACGIGESDAAELLGKLMDRDADPHVGTTAHGPIVSARVRARQTTASVEAVCRSVEEAWFPWVYSRGDTTLAQVLGAELLARAHTLAVAESCTAGGCSSLLTEGSGASAWFKGGVVSYANEVKRDCLGINEAILNRVGAVSSEVAMAMAAGVASRLSADWGIGITGIAGPSGAVEGKPVGTVFIGWQGPNASGWRRFRFPGSRSEVRLYASMIALQSLRFAMLGRTERLLWEVEGQ